MYFPCSGLPKKTHPSTPINTLREQLNFQSSSDQELSCNTRKFQESDSQQVIVGNPEDQQQKELHLCMKIYTHNQELKELIELISHEIEKQSEESLSIMKNIKQMGQEVAHWQRGYFDITKSILGTEEKIAEAENSIRDEKLKKQYKQLDQKLYQNTCKDFLPSYNSVTSDNQPSQQSILSSKKQAKTHENSRHYPTPQKEKNMNKYDTPIKQIFLKQSSDKKYKKITPKASWQFQQTIPPLFSPQKNLVKEKKEHFDPKIRNKSANGNTSNSKVLERQRKKIFVHEHCFDRKKLGKKYVRPFV